MEETFTTPSELLHQSVTLLTPGDPVVIPVTAIDAYDDESISSVFNFGFQAGACFFVLLVALLLTPPAKLRRPSSVLHIAGLAVCIVRAALAMAISLSPADHFYEFWSGDYSSVPRSVAHTSVAGSCTSLLLVMVLEAALMHQAWALVSLWPRSIKVPLLLVSGIISLVDMGWRFANVVIQNKGILAVADPRDYYWIFRTALITDCVSIVWYCALFNVKLVLHMLANRGILRSASAAKSLSPMEVLAATNGILMIVPVLFAALQWGSFTNFEPASLSQTSVVLILPLGTLAAQQMTRGGTLSYVSTAGSPTRGRHGGNGSDDGAPKQRMMEKSGAVPPPSTTRLPSVSTTCGSTSPRCLSAKENGFGGKTQRLDHFDLELQRIECDEHVEFDTDLEKQETRI